MVRTSRRYFHSPASFGTPERRARNQPPPLAPLFRRTSLGACGGGLNRSGPRPDDYGIRAFFPFRIRVLSRGRLLTTPARTLDRISKETPMEPHAILGVEPDASVADIRAAYKRLALEWHPDLNSSRHAGARMAAINHAFDAMTSNAGDAQSGASTDGVRPGPPPPPMSPTGLTDDELRHTLVACERCGRSDLTLRISVMVIVRSAVLASWRRGQAELLCEECRGAAALRANAQSALLGWWSLPGLALVPLEAFRNARGGRQAKAVNDDILLALSETWRARGDSVGREAALHERLAVHDASDGRGRHGRLTARRALLSLIPTCVAALAIIGGITAIIATAGPSPRDVAPQIGATVAVLNQSRAIYEQVPRADLAPCPAGLDRAEAALSKAALGLEFPETPTGRKAVVDAQALARTVLSSVPSMCAQATVDTNAAVSIFNRDLQTISVADEAARVSYNLWVEEFNASPGVR